MTHYIYTKYSYQYSFENSDSRRIINQEQLKEAQNEFPKFKIVELVKYESVYCCVEVTDEELLLLKLKCDTLSTEDSFYHYSDINYRNYVAPNAKSVTVYYSFAGYLLRDLKELR